LVWLDALHLAAKALTSGVGMNGHGMFAHAVINAAIGVRTGARPPEDAPTARGHDKRLAVIRPTNNVLRSP
jgi:hypothetical protein